MTAVLCAFAAIVLVASILPLRTIAAATSSAEDALCVAAPGNAAGACLARAPPPEDWAKRPHTEAGAATTLPPTSAPMPAQSQAAGKQRRREDLLTQEVEELEAFIKVCEHRIRMLEELQAIVASGHDIPLPEAHRAALQENVPLLSELPLEEQIAPIGSAEDYLVTKAIISQEEPMDFIGFMPLRNPKEEGSSPMVALPPALLVTAQVAGMVKVFTPSGKHTLTFASGHEHPLVQLAVSPSQDEHTVVTADAGGVIRVHKLVVKQVKPVKDEPASPPPQHHRKLSDKVKRETSQHLGPQLNASVQFRMELGMNLASDGAAAHITSFCLPSQQGQQYFVVGDAEGSISVFTKNGTLKAKMSAATVPGSGIEGFYAQPGDLLFWAGSEWGFLDLEKLDVRYIECPGLEGRIVAAAIDEQQQSRIIAADENGSVWVFHVARGRRHCEVEHRFVAAPSGKVVDLASMRGFLLRLEGPGAGDSGAIAALNMSHVQKKRWEVQLPPSSVVWRRGFVLARAWAVHRRKRQGALLALLSRDGREVEVSELLMTVYTPPPDGLSWSKIAMIVGFCIVVLACAAWKFCRPSFIGKGDEESKEKTARHMRSEGDDEGWMGRTTASAEDRTRKTVRFDDEG
mmetsp:Transcript_40284/g.110879  ORF Transcript_40284/g.110879 Transcript_40284/m.110879 type:complete len:630 (-) Transcript_40284:125-2014(-)